MNFKQAFANQTKLKRQQLQYALKTLGYYSFGIDGLWGKGTAAGFDNFVNRNGLVGKTEFQVFHSLLSKVWVPNSFKQKPVKKECSSSNVGACTAQTVCSEATYKHAGSIAWLPYVTAYVKEAKKRGLNCGVRQN